jgi:hypothetical protein
MSFENPTRLRIGMHGNFGGKDYRVIGRVVLGESEDGETYYWNEFNLVARPGEEATLVFEQTEHGPQWRLFTMFEPECPLTAADAATKRVGDRLNLTGDDVRVTFRGSSRVYRIEGEAPEGVEVGDAAEYFNAEGGSLMQVVSWTGDEVEYYNGVNLASGLINSAFNLPYESGSLSRFAKAFSPSGSSSGSGNYTSGLKFLLQAGAVVLLFFLIFGRSLSCSASYESAPTQKMSAAPPPLTLGATGILDGKSYRVTAHAVVEIDETGSIFERHEYQLTDDNGKTSRLVCGLQPGDKNWTMFTPLDPLEPPRAAECAAKKIGDAVNVSGVDGTVREIFLSTVRSVEGDVGGDWLSGAVRFGYLAKSDYHLLLVRWSTGFVNAISFERGVAVPAEAAKAAFTAK